MISVDIKTEFINRNKQTQQINVEITRLQKELDQLLTKRNNHQLSDLKKLYDDFKLKKITMEEMIEQLKNIKL